METGNEALLRDMLEWLAKASQPYETVMDAWRTSCPRLSIWEDAVDRGLVQREYRAGRATVRITDAGRDFLTRTAASLTPDQKVATQH